MSHMSSPAWLGIGAQRSGTTWFTDLLCQHPQVGLGTNNKKEQHLLNKVGDGLLPWTDYDELFPADGVHRGEWTPQYLRHASLPGFAARTLSVEAPVLVLLRDPVDRFVSAMRLAATRAKSPWPYPVPITVQAFTGMYADHLSMWRHHFGPERMMVMVFEEVRTNPQLAVEAVWSRLGLAPVVLTGVDDPSSSSSKASWEPPDGLLDSLRSLYSTQVDQLEADWALDLATWTSVRG